MSFESDDDTIDQVFARPGDDSAWQRLESTAAADPSLWRRFAEASRVESRMKETAALMREVADRVPLPPGAAFRRNRWTRRLPRIAAAALLMAAAVGTDRLVTRPWPSAPARDVPASADEVLADYLDRGERAGRILRSLPELVLEQRPAASGAGVEVFYVRRILERRVLPAVYELLRDERGEPVAVPVAMERLKPDGRL